MTWVLHIANAQHQFGDLIEPITTAVRGAQERCESVTEPLAIDVIVQALPGRVIPERGYVGHAPNGTMMQLTFDPANANLEACLGETLERMIAHEFHHVLRWRGPGYGRTLGEALVSEGLAGWFAAQLYREKPEPWENALLDVEVAELAVVADARWDTFDYDHDDWFFGRSGLPRWGGYTLGYQLVGAFLTAHPDQTAASLAATSARQFLPFLGKLQTA